MYGSISRAVSGFASLRLLREAGAHADESLSLLPRGSYRGSFIFSPWQERPPRDSPRADVHAIGAVIYYFVGGHSGLSLPFELNPWVITYLAPVVFLGGLGMSLYGFFLRMRS